MDSKYLDFDETRKMIGITRIHLRRILKRGDLIMHDKRWFKKTDVLEFIKAQTEARKAFHDRVKNPEETKAKALSNLVEFQHRKIF